MAYRIEITLPAEKDIYLAYERIKNLAPHLSAEWLRGLFKTIFSLQEMPDRCAFAPEAVILKLPIRNLLYGKRSARYRIIFDFQDNVEIASRVRILRVWHGARDRIKTEDLEP